MNRITRRQYLAAAGASTLALGLGNTPAAAQMATIRQGYQTNIWGMPTYYLLKSGALEKHGIKFEEFAVASGNITMQQMVARQVDIDRKSTRLNSSHVSESRMPSSACKK